MHFSPYDGEVHPGELYAGHGFWDTYRTAYPLYALLFPEDYASFLRGWINSLLRRRAGTPLAQPGYRVCMLSTHVDARLPTPWSKTSRASILQKPTKACVVTPLKIWKRTPATAAPASILT